MCSQYSDEASSAEDNIVCWPSKQPPLNHGHPAVCNQEYCKGEPSSQFAKQTSIYYFRRHQFNTILSNSYIAIRLLWISQSFLPGGGTENIFNVSIFKSLKYSPRWGARGTLQLLSLSLWVFKILSNIQFRDRYIFYRTYEYELTTPLCETFS